MGKFINLEFFLLLSRFLSNINRRDVAFDFVLPLLLALILAYYMPLPPSRTIPIQTVTTPIQAMTMPIPLMKIPPLIDYSRTLGGLKEIAGIIINVVAILIGFTLAIFTILVSGASKNLNRIKTTESADHYIDKKANLKASVFQEMLNNIAFMAQVEFSMLIIAIVTVVICNTSPFISYAYPLYICNLTSAFCLVAMNVRNITNMYLIFWTDGDLKNDEQAEEDASENATEED